MIQDLIAKRYIIAYLIIFVIFRIIFKRINSYYIKDPQTTPHPIDVHAFETKKYADPQYIIDAKIKGYDHQRYFKSFLPIDLIYPFLYSMLFLSCLLYCVNPVLRNLLSIVIIAGAVLDWLEDLTFAVFLSSKTNSLASVVAFFSSIKTVVFILNLLACIFWLAVAVKTLIVNI